MKILVAHNFYRSHQLGGEDKVVQTEVDALKQTLGKSNVFTYFSYNDDIKSLPLIKNIWGNRHHANNIAKLIKQHKIDILHIHNEFPLLTPLIFEAASKLNCKVVQTLHNFRNQCLSGTLYRNHKICEQCVKQNFKWRGFVHGCYRNSRVQSLLHALAQTWYCFKRYHQAVDYYFVLTNFQKNKLIEYGVPEKKLILKPNFIQQPLNLVVAQNRRNYLFIGRIEPGKGIETLLNVWDALPSHFVLNIIGAGELAQSLQKKYRKENINFLGSVQHDKTMSELKKAKYLVHPAKYYETFGLTIVEALSVGVPVIGFPIGTRTELITDGYNGLLCEEAKLKQTIMSSLEHPHYLKMSENALRSAKRFYADAVMTQQVELYQKILHGSMS